MRSNKHLHNAKTDKNDEFYTKYCRCILKKDSK